MHPLRVAFEKVDPAALRQCLADDVVFWSPILTGPVSGGDLVVRILGTAAMGFGAPTITGEFSEGGNRTVVTAEGSMEGNLLQMAILVSDGADGKVKDIKVHMRPWPVVTLFQRHMKPNLEDVIPAPLWELQPLASSTS